MVFTCGTLVLSLILIHNHAHMLNSYETMSSCLQDAKEHLAALADKLGPSLTDIDVSELQ